jgi:hypothetical protein
VCVCVCVCVVHLLVWIINCTRCTVHTLKSDSLIQDCQSPRRKSVLGPSKYVEGKGAAYCSRTFCKECESLDMLAVRLDIYRRQKSDELRQSLKTVVNGHTGFHCSSFATLLILSDLTTIGPSFVKYLLLSGRKRYLTKRV